MAKESNKVIEINNYNIKKINYDIIIAVAVAENGAQGEPGGFQAVDEKLRIYHSNLNTGKVSYKKLVSKFRLLKGFNCACTDINKKNLGWKWFDLGGGNSLLIREKYYKLFNESVIEKLGKDYKKGELYKNWLSILKSISDNFNDEPWWFSFEFHNIDEIIDYVKVYNEAPLYVRTHKNKDGTRSIDGCINYDGGLFKITKFLVKNKYVFEEYYDNEKYSYLFRKRIDIKDIDDFDIEQVSYLILRCFNIERICEGTIKIFLESRLLLRLIERAKELKGE